MVKVINIYARAKWKMNAILVGYIKDGLLKIVYRIVKFFVDEYGMSFSYSFPSVKSPP